MEGVFRYVHMLRSPAGPNRCHVGLTKDLPGRRKRHHAGQVLHTAKLLPWQVEVAGAMGGGFAHAANGC